jgi:putative alpha-1,2-mannosidase
VPPYPLEPPWLRGPVSPRYLDLGYIPQGCSDADVSRSMNYWHSDYALAQAATELARVSGSDSSPLQPNISYQRDAEQLLSNSANWIKLLDPETGHFRVKGPEGDFLPTFDEFAWGPSPGYTEAGPWQYRFEVPYDPKGLQVLITRRAHKYLPVHRAGVNTTHLSRVGRLQEVRLRRLRHGPGGQHDAADLP